MGERVAGAVASLLFVVAAPAAAQDVPTIDTEDASLGATAVGSGGFHPIVAVDIRNGDFARGGYDDDAANLDRVPVHVQAGFAWGLHSDAAGRQDRWVVATSSNGFHTPVAAEKVAPRGWYESNNLLGVVAALGAGVRVGAAYAIKVSPNGVSDTTHELSLTAALDGERGIAALHPSAAVTTRTPGTGGVFTQVAIAPELGLGRGDATLSFPALVGVGWGGFYAAGSGDVTYGSAGVAVTQPFAAGGANWRLRGELLAVVRDDTLRRLGSLDAETATVVPLATVTLALAL